jgi:hypothetical protein
MSNETITLTFGEAGENHVGMKMEGKRGAIGSGFNFEDLTLAKEKFSELGFTCELIHLNELYSLVDVPDIPDSVKKAYVLVIRNGLDYFIKDSGGTSKDMFSEMNLFEWDTKYFDTRRQKVLNKHARSNVCFGDDPIEPNYEEKQGRVVGYNQVKYTKIVKEQLEEAFGPKGKDMICEGNRYYDINKCGIGWHGDAERKKVIALRLGATIPLKYQWFHKTKPFGEVCTIELNDGDMYVMSEKAAGYDWKMRSIYTLRHCAGCDKYTKGK